DKLRSLVDDEVAAIDELKAHVVGAAGVAREVDGSDDVVADSMQLVGGRAQAHPPVASGDHPGHVLQNEGAVELDRGPTPRRLLELVEEDARLLLVPGTRSHA